MTKLKTKASDKKPAAMSREASGPRAAKLAVAKPKREKLPSLAELKRQLAAGADTAVERARANTRKLLGRDIL